MNTMRTIISAMNPQRYEDDYCSIWLWVWFEELNEPVLFLASPFDCERHGKELWIRAMAGEFGAIEVFERPTQEMLPPVRMIEYHAGKHNDI